MPLPLLLFSNIKRSLLRYNDKNIVLINKNNFSLELKFYGPYRDRTGNFYVKGKSVTYYTKGPIINIY